jgi:hypothetical protein
MLESLDINGRTYIPSGTASLEVGYTEDFIERLARGKWIDASFVQGKCFVDVASLMGFIAATERDAGDQLIAVAKRERVETILAQYDEKMHRLPGPSESWLVIGQVGVVTMCGLLMGLLSLSAVEANLTWKEFSDGVSQTASVLRERVVPPAAALFLFESSSQFDE